MDLKNAKSMVLLFIILITIIGIYGLFISNILWIAPPPIELGTVITIISFIIDSVLIVIYVLLNSKKS